jgi:WD40 repeat protein
LAFSPDGRLLAWGTADFTISVLDLSGSGLRKLSGHTDAVNSLTFSSGSDWLFSGSSDGTTRTWHVETGVPGTEWLRETGFI